MEKTWEIDAANTVKARFGAFGRKVVTVNGTEVHDTRKAGKKGGIAFRSEERRVGRECSG